MKFLKTLSDLADGAEAGVVLLAGTALALTWLVGLPVWLTWILFRQGRFVAGSLVAMVVALMTLIVLRDVRARRWTLLSVGLAVVWTLCTVYVGLRFLFE